LIGRPRLHVIVIKGVGHAQHIGGGVLGVVVDAMTTQVTAATRFKVNPEHNK